MQFLVVQHHNAGKNLYFKVKKFIDVKIAKRNIVFDVFLHSMKSINAKQIIIINLKMVIIIRNVLFVRNGQRQYNQKVQLYVANARKLFVQVVMIQNVVVKKTKDFFSQLKVNFLQDLHEFIFIK